MKQTGIEAIRVTGGSGGEALLFIGSEKTALYDTGMEFYGQNLVNNIKRALGGRTLDYVLLSHTHYDHIGGLPHLRKEWPGLIAVGNEHGQKSLKKPSALKAIRQLRDDGARQFQIPAEELDDYDDEALTIDLTVKEGDEISLGDKSFRVYETPGHTRCSLAYLLEPNGILFASETTGCYIGSGRAEVPVLTGFQDTLDSVEKCRKLGAKKIYSPHYLLLEEDVAQRFWDIVEEEARQLKDYVIDMHDRGLTLEEMIRAAKETRWTKIQDEQPLLAFIVNTRSAIRVILREFRGVEI